MAQRIINGEQYEALLIRGDLNGGPVPVACREPPSLFCFEDLKNCPSLHHSLLRQNQLAKPFCSLFHPAKHRCISQSWWKMQVCGRSRRMQENTSDVCLWSNELEVHAQQLWNFFWAVPGQQTARAIAINDYNMSGVPVQTVTSETAKSVVELRGYIGTATAKLHQMSRLLQHAQQLLGDLVEKVQRAAVIRIQSMARGFLARFSCARLFTIVFLRESTSGRPKNSSTYHIIVLSVIICKTISIFLF